MKNWSATFLRFLLSAAACSGAACGSDYGGLLGFDGSTATDAKAGDGAGSAPDGGTDAAAQADGRVDVAVSPPDGGASTDAGATADMSQTPDSSVGADVAFDGSGGADAVTTRDARADVTDMSTDVRVDIGTLDGGSGDTHDSGSTGGAVCGDGVKQASEECDDGNKLDFDKCSSICTDRRACTCCQQANDPLKCSDMDGTAEGGPKFGTPKSQLCQEAYTCFIRSRCGTYRDIAGGGTGLPMECYCGLGNVDTSSNGLCIAPAAGPCMTEMEAGLEVEETSPSAKMAAVLSRISADTYGAGMAQYLTQLEASACPEDCKSQPPKWVVCSNPDLVDGGDASTSPDVADTGAVDSPASEDVSSDISSGPADANDGGPAIDRDCYECLLAISDVDGGGMNLAEMCPSLTGNAPGGPGAGVSNRQLCQETLDCYHRTNCHSNTVSDCFCGTLTLGACNSATTTDGVCRTEILRSLEVPDGSAGSVALDRMTDGYYAGGSAGVVALVEANQDVCRAACIPYSPTQRLVSRWTPWQ